MTTPAFSTLDRLKTALYGLIAEMLPDLAFAGSYEYSVTSQSGKKIDAEPCDPSIGLPNVKGASMRPLLGGRAQYANGAKIIIMFLNRDPSKPYVLGGDPDTDPETLDLLGGTLPVARQGDQTQSFLPPTLPIVGTLSGAPFTGTITVANPISGSITGGSATVSSA